MTDERAITDQPGYEDNFEYFAENGTVRVVTARGSITQYDTWPFEKWASFRAAEIALERVREATTERLGHDDFGSGIGRPPGVSGTTYELIVNVYVQSSGSTDTPPGPANRLERLIQAAPRSVDTTVSLEGDEYSRPVPVYADHVVLRTL